jgi:hypothetical protein
MEAFKMKEKNTEVLNQSTGLFSRNPTRVEITNNADSQQEIVDIMRGGAKQPIVRAIYEYNDIDKSDPPPMSGILKIREMTEEQRIGFFRSLMRYKQNIIKVHISLGNYEKKRRITNSRTNLLVSNKQRFHTEVAEKMADVFSDLASNVVEMVYTVTLSTNSIFTNVEVYGVSREEYEDDKSFAPVIGIEYFVER